MKSLLDDVRSFHEATDTPVRTVPAIYADRADLRVNLIEEEARETIEAIRAGDVVETADGLADIIYVCVGAALEFGIPLDRVWDEVQRSNMAKVDPVTGKVSKRKTDQKVLKPIGWQPPDIRKAVFG